MNEKADKLEEILLKRRSCRDYTGGRIAEGDLEQILRAGLLAPSGKNKKETLFCVLQGRERMEQLALCRAMGAKQLEKASAAIVVLGNAELSDTWVEDCSLAMGNMLLMADALGYGACWIQCRMRAAASGVSTEEYVTKCLEGAGLPETARVLAILSLGTIAGHPEARPVPETVESGRVCRLGETDA